jgi:hypothetical protein
MFQKKICMLGSHAVGKTSLIHRYVHTMFSSNYLTTVGVKIDRKKVSLTNQEVQLLIWDLHGEDHFQKIRSMFIEGSAGYLLVVDGTRPETLRTALDLQGEARSIVGDVPFIVLVNKCDLREQWRITDQQIQQLKERNWRVHETSAKTGEMVEETFRLLSQQLVDFDARIVSAPASL